MADLQKLKRRNSLGSPPTPNEASQNLNAPEVAPAGQSATSSQIAADKVRLDARSLRRTGRTLQFATRVSSEFDEKLRYIAQRDQLLLVEVLEHALDAYEQAANK